MTIPTIWWMLHEIAAFCGNWVKLRNKKGTVNDWCPTFRNSVVIPYSKVEWRRTGNSILQNDTTQSRNVGQQSPSAAAQYPKRLDTVIFNFIHFLLPLTTRRSRHCRPSVYLMQRTPHRNHSNDAICVVFCFPGLTAHCGLIFIAR